MAEHAATALANLLVQVSLLAAETPEAGVDARPGLAPAGELTQTLHGDLEWPGRVVGEARVGGPLPVHPIAPGGLEVCPDHAGQVIGQQRPLDHVPAGRVLLEVLQEGREGPGLQEDVRIEAAHHIGIGFPKDQVARRGTAIPAEWDVPQVRHSLVESFEVRGRWTLGVIVEDDERHGVGHFRVVDGNGLDGEPDAVEVVECRHPDAEPVVPDRRGRLVDRARGLFFLRELALKISQEPTGLGHRLEETVAGAVARHALGIGRVVRRDEAAVTAPDAIERQRAPGGLAVSGQLDGGAEAVPPDSVRQVLGLDDDRPQMIAGACDRGVGRERKWRIAWFGAHNRDDSRGVVHLTYHASR
jgi:hypothetical protein